MFCFRVELSVLSFWVDRLPLKNRVRVTLWRVKECNSSRCFILKSRYEAVGFWIGWPIGIREELETQLPSRNVNTIHPPPPGQGQGYFVYNKRLKTRSEFVFNWNVGFWVFEQWTYWCKGMRIIAIVSVMSLCVSESIEIRKETVERHCLWFEFSDTWAVEAWQDASSRSSL